MFVVTGATGNTGSVVAATLLDAGKDVTVVVRSAAKAQPWRARGANVVEADIADAAALTQAFVGASGAYLMLPSSGDSDDFLGARAAVANAYTEAAVATGLPHAVLLSSFGAQHSSGTGPVRALHAAEKKLSAIPKLTVLRACWFLENFLHDVPAARSEGVLREFLSPGQAIPMIATRDIGAAAAELLLHPPESSSVVEIAGPEDYTPEDIVAVLGEVLGRTVRYEALPPRAAVELFVQFGATEDTARLYAELFEGVNAGRLNPLGSPRRMAISPREFFSSQAINAAAAHSS